MTKDLFAASREKFRQQKIFKAKLADDPIAIVIETFFIFKPKSLKFRNWFGFIITSMVTVPRYKAENKSGNGDPNLTTLK